MYKGRHQGNAAVRPPPHRQNPVPNVSPAVRHLLVPDQRGDSLKSLGKGRGNFANVSTLGEGYCELLNSLPHTLITQRSGLINL